MLRHGVISVLVASFLLVSPLRGEEKRLGRSRPARVWLRDLDFEISPTFVSFDRSERSLGLEWTVTRRRGIRDDRLSLALARLEVEEPEERFRFRFARFRAERRNYLRHRLYIGYGGGWHLFNPRTAIRDWQLDGGMEASTRFEPYLHAALGWQIGRWRFRRRWHPLALRAEYLKGSPYAFERALPSGLDEVDPSGWRLGLRSEFRF